MRKALALCLSWLFCLPALADTGPRWVQVKTEHFTVLSDAGDRQARDTAVQLERMAAVFARLLPHATADSGSRIVVLALKNRKGFQALEPEPYLAKNALDLAGLFMQRQDRSYILLRLDTTGEHPYSTVYHEYVHYLNRHAEYLPVWLNEGMAEFYENTDLGVKSARLGEASKDRILFLRQQSLIPLPTLFAVDHNSPYYHDENKGSVFYAESWALTHMLFIEGFQTHTQRLHDYVMYLAKGESSVAAAQHAFGDLKQLQQQLDSYINRGDYSELTMPLENTTDESSLPVQPVSGADADAIRADVMMENGRREEAKALIEEVLKTAPENPQLHESMGMLELREGHQHEAQKWYGEAVALHATSYLAYYYFGVLSMQMGNGPADPPSAEVVGTSLHEALRLNPKFAPAADALAHFDVMHGEMEEASHMALLAVTLDPGNISYRLNAAEIRLERKDFVSATSILENAEKVASTPEEHQRIEARLAYVKRYQAQLEEAEKAPSRAGEGGAANGPAAPGGDPGAQGGEVRAADGTVLHPTVPVAEEHELPAGPPSGPQHTIVGVLHSVGCFYPKGLTLSVNRAGKQIALYSNDMYSVRYTASNFTPTKELNPCHEFEGVKATVTYAEVQDKAVAGQIVAIELTK